MTTTRRKSARVDPEFSLELERPKRGRKPAVKLAELSEEPASPRKRIKSPKRISLGENGAVAAPASPKLVADAAAPAPVAESPWDKAITRTKSTFVMMGSFFVLIYLGHVALVAFILFLQSWIFKELLELRDKTVFRKLKEDRTRYRLPMVLDWHFFFTSCYYIYGRLFLARFDTFYLGPRWLSWLAEHHTFISFLLYCIGFLGFVFSLEQGMYKIQFKQLVWTTMILSVMVFQSSFYIHSIFEGMIWFFLPCALVIANDIWAYIVGFFFGKHPLIQLSPKKTWEGFIGGTIASYFFAIFFTWLLSRWDWMTCPKEDLFTWSVSCTPDHTFQWQVYELPQVLIDALSKIGMPWVTQVHYLPVQLHALALATFASLIAPFGGFFASGFKRGLQIKDFGESIPGHGGITDRMDCQILMGMFAYVYITNFVRRNIDLASLINTILSLTETEQRQILETLKSQLQ